MQYRTIMRFGAAVLGFGIPAVAVAQSATDAPYVPNEANPQPIEVLAIVVSARSCGPCNVPEYKSAVRRMMPMLARQVAKSGASFAAVGLGLDWNVDTARAYFQTLGAFDELVLGRNWWNTGAVAYMWRESVASPAMPQVVLVRRHTIDSQPRMTVSADSVIVRLVGEKQIVAWVARGAPIAARISP
jgi:hypothetical protein